MMAQRPSFPDNTAQKNSFPESPADPKVTHTAPQKRPKKWPKGDQKLPKNGAQRGLSAFTRSQILDITAATGCYPENDCCVDSLPPPTDMKGNVNARYPCTPQLRR